MIDIVSSLPSEETPTPILRISLDGRLVVLVDDAPIRVRLRQCFPWSEPGLHLSLRDDEDREIAIVADPEDLDDWPRALPNGDLRRPVVWTGKPSTRSGRLWIDLLLDGPCSRLRTACRHCVGYRGCS
jgi:hypothetical protein